MTDLNHVLSHWSFGIDLLQGLLLFLLILTRWLIMTIMIPFLGGHILPTLLRLIFAGTLSVVSFLLLINSVDPTLEFSIFLIGFLFLKEALLGLILGFLASLIFYTYQFAGELIDLARAASMSKLLVPEFKHQSSPLGVLLFQLSLVIFINLGYHRSFIVSIYDSFESFPIYSFKPNLLNDQHFFTMMMSLLGTTFDLALRFAIPVMLICFLVDLAFGLLNRIAPQINAYFLSLPAKIMGGLAMFFLILPFLMEDFGSSHNILSHFFHFFVAGNY
jgi:flagellar biosynthesis protein FliR